jgi:UDP-glucose 4-epimerase
VSADTSARTCLVLGDCGFIGSHVAAEFAAAGYEVAGVDRSATGAPGVRHISLALPSPELADVVADVRPSVIVNAAGPASVAGSIEDPRSDFHGTVDVLLGVLDAVRASGVAARVVAMSSAAVYGNPSELPVTERADLAPVSPYGYHRIIAETLLREYASVFGVESCAARVFSAYGPGLRRQLLWDVCRKAAESETVHLFGTGEETRDFVHVADVARAVRVLGESAAAPACGEAYNVASGVETSVAEIARTLLATVRPDATLTFSGEQRPGDPLRWRADVSAIRGLGFEPQMPIGQGLAEYAAWYVAEAGR